MLKKVASFLVILSFLAQNAGWASQHHASQRKELIPSVYSGEIAQKPVAAVENKEQGAELIDNLLNRNLKRRSEIAQAAAVSPEPRAAKPVTGSTKSKSAIPPASPLNQEDQVALNGFVVQVQRSPRSFEIQAILESVFGVTLPLGEVESQVLLKDVLKKDLNSDPYARFTAILDLKDALAVLEPNDRTRVGKYLKKHYGGLDLNGRISKAQFDALVASGGILFRWDGVQFTDPDPFHQLLASTDVESSFLTMVDNSLYKTTIREILQSVFGGPDVNFNDSKRTSREGAILNVYGILYDRSGDPVLRPLEPFETAAKAVEEAKNSIVKMDELKKLGIDVLDGISPDEFKILARPLLLAEMKALFAELRETPALLTGFNNLFGTKIQLTGNLGTQELAILFSIVGGTPNAPAIIGTYDRDKFLNALKLASDLLTELKKSENAMFLADFNAMLRTSISTVANDLNPHDRNVLLYIVGDQSFNLDKFKLAIPKMKILFAYLTTFANSADIAAFDDFFGTDISIIFWVVLGLDPKPGVLFDATEAMKTASDAEIVEFFRVLPLAGELLKALRTNPTSKSSFENLFGVTIPASFVIPVDATAAQTKSIKDARATLFNVTGAKDDPLTNTIDETYIQDDFFRVLPLAGQLLTTLRDGLGPLLEITPSNPPRLSFTAKAGYQYQIQNAASLSSSWSNLGAPISGTSSRIEVPLKNPSGFYRVQVISGGSDLSLALGDFNNIFIGPPVVGKSNPDWITDPRTLSSAARTSIFNIAGAKDNPLTKTINETYVHADFFRVLRQALIFKSVYEKYTTDPATKGRKNDVDFILNVLGTDHLTVNSVAEDAGTNIRMKFQGKAVEKYQIQFRANDDTNWLPLLTDRVQGTTDGEIVLNVPKQPKEGEYRVVKSVVMNIGDGMNADEFAVLADNGVLVKGDSTPRIHLNTLELYAEVVAFQRAYNNSAPDVRQKTDSIIENRLKDPKTGKPYGINLRDGKIDKVDIKGLLDSGFIHL